MKGPTRDDDGGSGSGAQAMTAPKTQRNETKLEDLPEMTEVRMGALQKRWQFQNMKQRPRSSGPPSTAAPK